MFLCRGDQMKIKFTLEDLTAAFDEYSEGTIKHLKELNEEEKLENWTYIKAIYDFLIFFTDDYCYNHISDSQDECKRIIEEYERYYAKSYDVKVYGQEYDASTADPVILKGVTAADAEDLKEKVKERARKESNIYAVSAFEILKSE